MGPPQTLIDVVERPAVVDDEGAPSYQELWTRARALASRLRTEGVRPGVVVAIDGRNRVPWVIAAFGASTCALQDSTPDRRAGPVAADSDGKVSRSALRRRLEQEDANV